MRSQARRRLRVRDDDRPFEPAGRVPGRRVPMNVPRVLHGVLRFVLDWTPVFIVMFAYDAIHNRLGVLLFIAVAVVSIVQVRLFRGADE